MTMPPGSPDSAAPRWGAEPIVLDYGGASGLEQLLRNLSGVAADGGTLWTVSDEGRTLERLDTSGEGYALEEQLSLDDVFPALPAGKEVDLEGLDVAGGAVWLCGSHSLVRRKPDADGRLNAGLRERPSRCLLGTVPAARPVGDPVTGQALPFGGEGSLRQRLRADPFVSAFLDLPGKENGLDIEGLAVRGDRLLLGLRGPVIDSFAAVVALRLDADGSIADGPPTLSFLDLGGLGIRDLARVEESVLVLAGPVTAADGPFRIMRWNPEPVEHPQRAELVFEWPLGREHPEGLCRVSRQGSDGLLVVYDSPDEARIQGSCYRADFFASVG